MKQHKMWTFLGVKSLISAAALTAAYYSGAQVDVIPNPDQNIVQQAIDYFPKALAVSLPSLAVRISLDATLLNLSSYISNRESYKNQLGSFFKRYFGVEGLVAAFDAVTGPLVIAGMLANNVPYAVTVFTNGKITAPLSAGLQLLLYKRLVVRNGHSSE